MADVVIDGVVKRFGNLSVIKEVSARVEDGEFTILVGPSGCGKSTLLRMIAGLEDIDGGAIAIDGTVVNKMRPKDRDIAMVFQNYALYPHLNVRKNMGFSLSLNRVPAGEIERRVNQAAEILALRQLLDRYPRQLSGGQRQRVAMGRAIVREPKVFLFDEPLSNLDAKLRVQMRAEIKALHAKLGTTMIYVTHDQIEAMTMADKIIVMRDGRIEQVGAPIELYNHPCNTFVAQFIGSPSMNLVDGRVENGFFLLGEGLRLPFPAPLREAGNAVQCGFRPEHVSIDNESGLPGIVEVVEPTGAETQVHLRIGRQQVICSFRDYLAVNPGDELRIRPDLKRIHLFDAGGNRTVGSTTSEKVAARY
ncbi:ABC transporter ATP-binding protein [Mesorhizobium sp. 1B3]|uniref:ABC transporter ATP-binding protein n=1 Tax=Mesorhizobium sp. 1B3 TaxID=3243599 RepID=UPI003D96B98D